VTLQTCAPENVRSCRWGDELPVKHAQTWSEDPHQRERKFKTTLVGAVLLSVRKPHHHHTTLGPITIRAVLYNLGSWFSVCNLILTQLNEIRKTTSIFLKMEDDLNFPLRMRLFFERVLGNRSLSSRSLPGNRSLFSRSCENGYVSKKTHAPTKPWVVQTPHSKNFENRRQHQIFSKMKIFFRCKTASFFFK
jgi:hypothetical protein